MLGHQIQQEESEVKPEDAVVRLSRVPQPGRDVLRRTAIAHQHGQCQCGRIARIAEAEIIHVDNPGELAICRYDDVLRRGIVQKRRWRNKVDLIAQAVQRGLAGV